MLLILSNLQNSGGLRQMNITIHHPGQVGKGKVRLKLVCILFVVPLAPIPIWVDVRVGSLRQVCLVKCFLPVYRQHKFIFSFQRDSQYLHRHVPGEFARHQSGIASSSSLPRSCPQKFTCLCCANSNTKKQTMYSVVSKLMALFRSMTRHQNRFYGDYISTTTKKSSWEQSSLNWVTIALLSPHYIDLTQPRTSVSIDQIHRSSWS